MQEKGELHKKNKRFPGKEIPFEGSYSFSLVGLGILGN
jgi:hypothetical protein